MSAEGKITKRDGGRAPAAEVSLISSSCLALVIKVTHTVHSLNF